MSTNTNAPSPATAQEKYEAALAGLEKATNRLRAGQHEASMAQLAVENRVSALLDNASPLSQDETRSLLQRLRRAQEDVLFWSEARLFWADTIGFWAAIITQSQSQPGTSS